VLQLANGLHASFGAIAVLCFVTTFGVNRFYISYSKTGTINKPLLFGCVFLDAITFSVLSLVCMLMASGYCLSRMNVSNSESRSITGSDYV
jgi:TM2 domain-containing membrane protein YozV